MVDLEALRNAMATVVERWAQPTALSLAIEMVPPFFCEDLGDNLGFEPFFDIHLLQVTCFRLPILSCKPSAMHPCRRTLNAPRLFGSGGGDFPP